MRLTNDVQESDLTLHGVRVDLAHIPSSVRLPYLLDMQIPSPVVRMTHPYPMVLGDHVTVYRQDSLRVDSQPGHLNRNTIFNQIKKSGLSCKLYINIYRMEQTGKYISKTKWVSDHAAVYTEITEPVDLSPDRYTIRDLSSAPRNGI